MSLTSLDKGPHTSNLNGVSCLPGQIPKWEGGRRRYGDENGNSGETKMGQDKKPQEGQKAITEVLLGIWRAVVEVHI